MTSLPPELVREAFVTGGTGFVGRALVRHLLDRGWKVRVLARNPSQASHLTALGAEVVAGDLLDPVESLASMMRGFGVVFHLAAWYQFGVRDEDLMARINVGGTERMVEAATQAGVGRFVHCSTVGAHGATGEAVCDEEHYDPQSVAALPYTRTKRAAHEVAQAAASAAMDVVLVSPTGIFGPGDTSMIGRLVGFAARGWMRVGFYRDTVMGFVHVDDVAQGLRLAAEQGRSGRDYILVNKTASLGEVLAQVCVSAGFAPPWFWLPAWAVWASQPLGPLFAPFLGQGPYMLRDAVAMMDGVSLRYDGIRARQELGWEPGPFDHQLAATVMSFGSEGPSD